MRFRVGRRRLTAGPGDTVRVPPGTVHHFANAARSRSGSRCGPGPRWACRSCWRPPRRWPPSSTPRRAACPGRSTWPCSWRTSSGRCGRRTCPPRWSAPWSAGGAAGPAARARRPLPPPPRRRRHAMTPPRSRSSTWSSGTAARHATRSTTSASPSRPASCSACSARTAPARRPPCRSSPPRSRPTSGRVRIAGRDLARDQARVRRELGVVFQQPSLDLNLTAEENIRLHAVLYGLYPWRPSYRLMPAGYRHQVQEMAGVLGMSGLLRPARPGRCPAACGAGWRSSARSCTGPGCCSSTSRPPAWTRRAGAPCGPTCARPGPSSAPPSS